MFFHEAILLFFFNVLGTSCGQVCYIFSLSCLSCSSCAIAILWASSLHFPFFSLVISFQSSDCNLVNDIVDPNDTCKHDSICWRGQNQTRLVMDDNIWIRKLYFVNIYDTSNWMWKVETSCMHASASDSAHSLDDKWDTTRVRNVSRLIHKGSCKLWRFTISINTGLVAYSIIERKLLNAEMGDWVVLFHQQHQHPYQNAYYCY